MGTCGMRKLTVLPRNTSSSTINFSHSSYNDLVHFQNCVKLESLISPFADAGQNVTVRSSSNQSKIVELICYLHPTIFQRLTPDTNPVECQRVQG